MTDTEGEPGKQIRQVAETRPQAPVPGEIATICTASSTAAILSWTAAKEAESCPALGFPYVSPAFVELYAFVKLTRLIEIHSRGQMIRCR
jgi:hypothetical protein